MHSQMIHIRFVSSILNCYSSYFSHAGRASRTEYWSFFLFYLIVFCVLNLIFVPLDYSFSRDGFTIPMIINAALQFAVLGNPSLMVCFRRLHDLNKSAWHLLNYLIVIIVSACLGGLMFESIDIILHFALITLIICFIHMVYLFCHRGTMGENRFGPDPISNEITQ